jgi:anaerobic selenocysteine-containing dehydrogenase
VKNDWVDRSFLETRTDADRESLWTMLAPWTPEKAGALCQVPADRILWTAETFARADRPVAILGSGVTGTSGGLENAQAILLLNFLVGNIDREGGYRSPARMEWKQPRPIYSEHGKVPVARGTLFWDLQKGNKKVGCLLSHDANPAVADPDADATAKTLRNEASVPFHVALASHWSETVRLADLVLPASTFLESWGLPQPVPAAGAAPWVSLRQPICGREEEARSLDELLFEIAQNLGEGWNKAFPFRDVEDYYRVLLDRNLSGGAFREAKKKGLVMAPGRAAGKSEDKYRVKSVLSHSIPRIAKGADKRNRKGAEEGEMTLILYAAPTRGGLDHPSDWVEEIDHADPVLVHPRAAQRFGLTDGDWVTVKGPAGSIKTRVRLTEGIHPEAVAMAVATVDREPEARCMGEDGLERQSQGREHWWKNESYGGNARKVVPWPKDPHQEAPGWMDTAVTITRLKRSTKG